MVNVGWLYVLSLVLYIRIHYTSHPCYFWSYFLWNVLNHFLFFYFGSSCFLINPIKRKFFLLLSQKSRKTFMKIITASASFSTFILLYGACEEYPFFFLLYVHSSRRSIFNSKIRDTSMMWIIIKHCQKFCVTTRKSNWKTWIFVFFRIQNTNTLFIFFELYCLLVWGLLVEMAYGWYSVCT